MSGNRTKRICVIALLTVIVFITKAQPGCPEVNAGNPVTLPCGTSCTTLTAVPFQTGTTATYTVSQIPYNPPVAFNTGTAIPVPANGDDYWSNVINLPFNFCFFDTAYTSLIVESNGAISFDITNAGSAGASWTIDGPFPTNAPYDLDNSIMGPYQDLDNTNQGTIYYYIGGTAPCRYFVATWDDLAMYGDVNSVNTDYCNEDDHQSQMIVIYETTNVIEIYIKEKDAPCDDGDGVDYWNGGLAVEGIEDAANATFIGVPGRNATQFSATNDAWRFTPAGPSNVSVAWYNGATQISTDSFVTVCPSNTTTYTAKATYAPCDGGAPVVVSDNVTVTLSGSLNAGVDSSKNVSCFGLNNGAIYAHVSGGTPPVTYGWSTGSTALTLTNLAPGTYIFTASDAASCVRSDTVIITQPTQLNATVPNVSQVNCTASGTGTLIVHANGGNTPYIYNWNNGEAGVNDTAIAAGNYTVIVTDSLACTATAGGTLTIGVGASSVIIDTLSVTNVTCFNDGNGGIIVSAVNGTPPYQYAWSNSQSNQAAVNLGPGPYTVTATDAGGCTAVATYTITQPQALVINAVVQNMACGANLTGAINASVTGGTPAFTYNWTEFSTGQTFTGSSITNLSPDEYSLTVTDANNCQDSASYTLTQSPALSYLDSVGNVTCNGGNDGTAQIFVTAGTPPYTFSWDYGPDITDSEITNLSAGPVEVIVTDSNDCSVQVFLNVSQPAPVSIQLVTATNVSCFGGNNGTITVAATGGTPGYTYAWNNTDTTASVDSLTAGPYVVVATDSNQCTGTASYTISQPTAITINTPDIQNIGCSGGNTGSITANVTNGTPDYTYQWGQAQGGPVDYTGQTISNLSVGNYFLTVTDANSCKDSSSYAITSIPLLTFTMDSIPVSCFDGNNGAARASITSGTPPYQFSWNNGPYGTDSTITNLTAGNLQVNVTDANNCIAITTIYISQPPPIVITAATPTEVSCNGGSNGEIVVNVTGGTPAYTLNWNNQFIGADNAHLPAGTYTLIVLDNNDCADTAHYTITQPTPIVVNPIAKNAVCYFGSDGTIDANPSGGVSPYQFSWNNGETTQVADNLTRGSYDCTVTDANLCTLVFTDTVGQPTPMVIQNSPAAVKCVGQKNGADTVTVSGETPPYNFSATNNNVDFIYATNDIIVGLDTGKYTIQVSDSNGCISLAYVVIPPAIPDEFYPPVADSTLCFGPDYNDGSVLVLDSTIQNGPYQYSIDGGALQDSGYFQNLSAGPHTVIAVSANNCIDSIPVFIPEPLPVEAIVTPDSITLPLGGSKQVLVTYLNATNPTFNWVNTLGFSCTDCPNPVVSSYAQGQYVVSVSMVNGTAVCYGSTTLYVNVLGRTKAFIPNVFTPNGDGVDDLFMIYGEDVQTASLKVFNRWGELVYSTTNSLAGWDGTYKGIIQMPAVFTYEAVITYLDNSQESRKGTVTLLR